MNEFTTMCTKMLQYAATHWYLMVLLLPLVGFLRSSMDGKKPAFLPDVPKVIKSWFVENSWLARFSIVFALILYPYVLLVWAVYGFVSVFDFIAFIFRKIWWLILWLWYEVLHPTVFAAARMIWHYVVVCAWRFFHFAFLHIPEGVKQTNILFAIRKLLVFAGLSAPLVIIYLLTLHVVVLVLFSIIIFYLFQYTVFSSVAFYRSDDFSHSEVLPGLRISFLWLSFSVVATALIVLISQFADVFVVSALGITVVQILLPLAIFFGLAFVATTLYLPSYMAENKGEIDIIPFMRTMLFRLPKLIFAQPFQIIGFAVLSIIPFLLMLILNTGLKEVTRMDYQSWISHVTVMDYHLPQVVENSRSIEAQQTLVQKTEQDKSAVRSLYDSQILENEAEISTLQALRNRIQDLAIHTFDRLAYVGETQSFSVPAIDGCSDFEWTVRKVPANNLIRREVVRVVQGSAVFYHRWLAPGVYTVSLSALNDCADVAVMTKQVQVEELPTVQFADNGERTDGEMQEFEMPETRYFVTREAGDYAIDMLMQQRIGVEQEANAKLKVLSAEAQVSLDTIAHLKSNSADQIHMLLAKIMGFLGLLFMAVLITSAFWSYWLTYHYDLWSSEQEGKHYWRALLDELAARNSHQPLLGIFVLLILGVALYVLPLLIDFLQ